MNFSLRKLKINSATTKDVKYLNPSNREKYCWQSKEGSKALSIVQH